MSEQERLGSRISPLEFAVQDAINTAEIYHAALKAARAKVGRKGEPSHVPASDADFQRWRRELRKLKRRLG